MLGVSRVWGLPAETILGKTAPRKRGTGMSLGATYEGVTYLSSNPERFRLTDLSATE